MPSAIRMCKGIVQGHLHQADLHVALAIAKGGPGQTSRDEREREDVAKRSFAVVYVVLYLPMVVRGRRRGWRQEENPTINQSARTLLERLPSGCGSAAHSHSAPINILGTRAGEFGTSESDPCSMQLRSSEALTQKIHSNV